MSDIISNVTRNFEASLPDSLDDQLRHLEEQRQTNPRLSRRERLIRQTTQPRMSDRRSFSSSILQRTPVRSSSFDVPITVDGDARNFRERFDNSRQTLFAPRLTGSNESLTTSPRLGRRQSDIVAHETRGTVQTGSGSGSGSSTPRTMRRNAQNLAESLTEAFAKSFDSMERNGSTRNSTVTSYESRPNSTVTSYESRPNSSGYVRQNMMPSSSSNLIGRSTRRERTTDSRYRRRTIGVDRSVREALETEKQRYSSQTVVENAIEREDPLSRSTDSYSRYSSGIGPSRKLEIYEKDTLPVLGLEDDLVIFVDQSGRSHWIRDNKQLSRSVTAKRRIPEIVVKKCDNDFDDNEGVVIGLKGEKETVYKQLSEYVKRLKSKEGSFDKNGDAEDTYVLSPEMIDEKYKTYSLYTKPRPRQNIESIIGKKSVIPLYDGIDTKALASNGPQAHSTKDISEWFQDYRPSLSYTLSFGHLRRAGQNISSANTQKNEPERTSRQVVSDRQPEYTSRETVNTRQASYSDNSDIHQEVNLVMERLHGLGMNIDTSNLDYEEMRMIQRALQDNPSPPESPFEVMQSQSVFENYYDNDNSTTTDMATESLDQYSTSEPIIEMEDQSFQTSEADRVSDVEMDVEFYINENSETTTELVSSQNVIVSDLSQKEPIIVNSQSETGPLTTEGETEQLNSQIETETFATQTDIEKSVSLKETEETPTKEEAVASEAQTKVVTSQMEIELSTPQRDAADIEGDQVASADTPSRSENRPRKASPPRSLPSERLPSQSAISPKLQLPSMDFSPLEKKSKRELDFPSDADKGSFSNGLSESRKLSTGSRKSTSDVEYEEIVFFEEAISPSRKNLQDPMERVSELLTRTNGDKYQQELSVQVPSDTEAERKSSPKVPTTPVKSRNPSSNASSAVSPAGSDTVTTTFEEFVAVLPEEVLMQIRKENDG